jgi:quercetin dioxygenase-like cupin family protein
MRTVFILVAASVATVSSALAQQAPGGLQQVLKETIPEFPAAAGYEARVMTNTVQPHFTGQWHSHPSPVIVFVTEGTFTLEVEGREPMRRKAGEALVEPVNVKLRAANHTDAPAKLVIIQVSPAEKPFSETIK